MVGELLRRAADLDPAVLVDAARLLPAWAGWICVAFGLGIASFGAHHGALRLTTACLAALAGYFAADAYVDPIRFGISGSLLAWLGAGALGLLGAAWPVAAAFAIFGLAGGPFFARWIPFDDPFLRVIPGAVACGVLGALFVRVMAALATACLGGALVAIGAAALLLAGDEAGWLVLHPVAALLPFLLVFISGAAFQLTRGPPPRRQEQEPVAGMAV